MSAFLALIAGQPRQKFDPGAVVLQQGGASDHLLVLIEGEVEVLRDEIRLIKVATPGALFGEMSILLNCPLTATVRALRPSTFALIAQPREFLASSTAASLHMAEEVIEIFAKHNIMLVGLPPATTHKMQPLDVGYIQNVKAMMRNMSGKKKLLFCEGNLALLWFFCHAELVARRAAEGKSILQGAFKKAGLVPLASLASWPKADFTATTPRSASPRGRCATSRSTRRARAAWPCATPTCCRPLRRGRRVPRTC